MGSPFSGGSSPPAPRRQCWIIVRLCRTSSLETKHIQSRPFTDALKVLSFNRPTFSLHQNVVFFDRTLLCLLTGSSPALPARTSAAVQVLAGESLPVNRKQRSSLLRWARAIGYPGSTGPRGDPSPSLGYKKRERGRKKISAVTFQSEYC